MAHFARVNKTFVHHWSCPGIQGFKGMSLYQSRKNRTFVSCSLATKLHTFCTAAMFPGLLICMLTWCCLASFAEYRWWETKKPFLQEEDLQAAQEQVGTAWSERTALFGNGSTEGTTGAEMGRDRNRNTRTPSRAAAYRYAELWRRRDRDEGSGNSQVQVR